MIPEKIRKILKKQHYRLVGKKGKEHSAVQICRWTKNSLRNEGVCYKEKFYGIESHRCCQMTPAVMWCQNQCSHCWRATELTIDDNLGKVELSSPKEIIDSCIKAQRKLLEGFKINPETKHITKSKADMGKFEEAQEPMQFAISLSGEPTLYPKLGELILELRKRRKTSFLVTNGLNPEKIKELEEKNQLPTQLYISVMAPEKEIYEKIVNSKDNNAWSKLNETLKIISELKIRTIFRMNLVRNLNMSNNLIKKYSELIKKAKPLFVEVKGYMAVGFARERKNMGYDAMPTFKEMKNFCEKLAEELGGSWKVLDSHKNSRAFVLGKKENEKNLKIKEFS